MSFRAFDANRDQKAVHRIWLETGWLDRDDENDARYFDIALSNCRAFVADIGKEAECLVMSVPGNILHLQDEISTGIVSAVTSSLIARKQGLASRLTAKIVAEDAESGMETSTLGMFEQGYYSRLGFGTGPYEHIVAFDPSRLNTNNKAGIPIRLAIDDFKDIHQAMTNRWRGHGGVQLTPQEHTHAELGWTENGFGLGYRDDLGELTHFVWGERKKESGPYKMVCMRSGRRC